MPFLQRPGIALLALGVAIAAGARAADSDGPAVTQRSPVAGPQRATLSLTDLEQMALQRNPTLAQAAANVEDARGRTIQSGLYPNPTVGYTGEQIGLRGPQAPGEMQGLFVDQVLVTAGKLGLNRAKFAQEA